MSEPCSKLIESQCRFESVRDAARSFRSFLSTQGVPSEELDSWELLITEAGNNIVEHAPEESRPKGINFLMNVWPETVELTIVDHSHGFEWPEDVDLPDDDSERGRGLFLIEALADEVRYVSGSNQSFLLIRKHRQKVEKSMVSQDGVEDLLEAMTAELASSYESLNAIFQLTAEISGKELTVTSIKSWLEGLTRIMDADWFVMRLTVNEQHALQTFATSPGLNLPHQLVKKSPHHIEGKALITREVCWFGEHLPLAENDPLSEAQCEMISGIVHPIYVGDEAFGTLTVGKYSATAPFTSGHLSIIRTAAHFLGMRMRNTRAQMESLQAKLVSTELQAAAGVQKSLLPKSLPKLPGLELATHSQSMGKLGGDFFDTIQFDDDGLLLVMADVMGKGAPAALFAAIFRSHLRAKLELASRPGELMTWLNKSLFADLDAVDMFVTAQLVYFDINARLLKVANAGHNPLLMISGENPVTMESSEDDPPIGISETAVYSESSYMLHDSARILLHTDGIVETRNPEGLLLGLPVLTAWFENTAKDGLNAEDTSLGLKMLISDYRQDAPVSDDVTFIVLVANTPSFIRA